MKPYKPGSLHDAISEIERRTSYPASCPKWLRPFIQIFRQRDVNRACAAALSELSLRVATQEGLIQDLRERLDSPGTHPPRRILLDVTYTRFTDHQTGIQRVVRNIAREFTRIRHPDTHLHLVRIDAGALRRVGDFPPDLNSGTPAAGHDCVIIPRRSDILVLIDSGWGRLPDYTRAIQQFKDGGGSVIGIIYDLIPLNHPQVAQASTIACFSPWFELLHRHCHALITISRSVALEVETHLAAQPQRHIPPASIGYFHLGSKGSELDGTPAVRRISPLVEQARKSAGTLFVMVGTMEPRKGYDCALDAFDRLWAENADVALCLAGRRGWNTEHTIKRIKQHPAFGKKLFWLDDCSDAELGGLYASADALIAASIAEGFGLPLIEAAQAGVPIICSDIPVFREVCGTHATYFTSGDPANLATVLGQWMQLKAAGLAPSSTGMPCLSWRDSANMLLQTITRLAPPA